MPPAVERTKAIGCLAVDQRREIELALDRGALLDVKPVDFLPMRPGLVRHEGRAEQAFSLPGDIVYRAHHLHAPGLAAPAGMDLRLDHQHRRRKRVRRLDGLLH